MSDIAKQKALITEARNLAAMKIYSRPWHELNQREQIVTDLGCLRVLSERLVDALNDRDEARDALQWCSAEVWEGVDMDGGTFQDHFESEGLLVQVPASKEFREEWDADTMYVWKWNAHLHGEGK